MGVLRQFSPLLLAIALLSASFLVEAAPNPAEPKIARITWGEWPPFHSRSRANNGLYSHLIREVYQAVGISVEYGVFPWKRALLMAQTQGSAWHGSSGWVKTPEREEEFLYTDAMRSGCVVFFHKLKTSFDWRRPESLSGQRVGVTSGYRSNSLLQEMKGSGLDIKVDEVSEEKYGIRMLNAERLDVFVSDKAVGQTILNQELSQVDASAITSHPQPLYCDTYHMVFPRQKLASQYLVQQFNVGLKILRDSGRYQEIMGEP